jgi:hypothetical protein
MATPHGWLGLGSRSLAVKAERTYKHISDRRKSARGSSSGRAQNFSRGRIALTIILWNDPSDGSQNMKPTSGSASKKRRFPLTDYSFQSGFGEWRGHSSPYDGDEGSDSRKFHNFCREFIMESARERAKEMAVFALVVVVTAWPVIYMAVTVVKLLSKGRPLGN